jgi:hypothetical protein
VVVWKNAAVLGVVGLLAAWANDSKLWLKATPQSFMPGRNVTLTCHVPARDENRWVNLGISDMTNSGKEIHGMAGPTFFTLDVKNVRCGVGKAFCNVLATDKETIVTTNLQVGGCESH